MPDPDADNSYGYTTQHVNDLWSIDLSGADEFTWQPVYAVGDRPSPREGHSAALVAERFLVVHGGFSLRGDYYNDTYVLDTQKEPMVWTRPTLTGNRPTSRFGHSLLSLIDDEVLSFGGMSLFGWSNEVHILQLARGNEATYPGVHHDKED